MAQHGGFLNSSDLKQRKYQDIDFARVFSLLTGGQGYVVGYLNELEVVATEQQGDTPQVIVKSGAAWIGEPAGWWYVNDADIEMQLDNSGLSAGETRTDRIVLKLNRETTELVISVEVKQGAEDVAPTLDEFSDVNLYTQELSLAQLVVTGDSNEVTIIDERNSEFCGAVRTIADSAGASSGFHPLALKADIQDLTLVKWNKEDGCWEGSDAGYMVFYEGKLYGNGSMIPVSGYATSDENTVYADGNGVMGTEVNKTIVGAFCENGAYLSVCVISEQVGVPIVYSDNMLQFNAVPALSGQIWLQIEKPPTANGVKIHRGSTPYDGTGLLWGTEIADITDDSEWHGPNKFYKSTGLTNDLQYYFKAFPYSGTRYNTLSGENESSCYAKNGLAFWNFDNTSGSTIIDDFNAYDLSGNNIAYTAQKIGNGAYINSTSSYMRKGRALTRSSDHTIVVWAQRPTSGYKRLWCQARAHAGTTGSNAIRSYGYQIAITSSGDVAIEYGTTSSSSHGTYIITVNADSNMHMWTIEFGSSGTRVYLDDSQTAYNGSFSFGTYPNNGSSIIYEGIGYDSYTSLGTTADVYRGDAGASLDQMRLFTATTLEQVDRDNLYNNGNGC